MSLRLVLARDLAGADIGRAFDEALRPGVRPQPRASAGHGGGGRRDAPASRRRRPRCVA